ncbi:MAG TPA: glycosyltransferase [Thermoanaerobaculia bacterium]|jgi:glycosyltransferase involved in cell wall biosynthesis
MRVLRIIARLNVGGPARHVVWLSEGLARDGVETLLVTGTVPPGEDDMSGFAAAHGVRPHVIPSMSRELSPRDVVSIWKLWRLMVRFRPDVVHTHTAKAGAVGRIAGLLYRVVSRGRSLFVHTFHGHVFHGYASPWKTRMFLAIERALARLNTDRIVVLSEQQRREIHETYRVGRGEQFVVIPLGIEPISIPESRHETTVGIVGRIAPIKNHEMFLRVAERLRGAARFVVYGDGAERARLEKSARGAAEFAGTRDAAEIYAAIDVLALTSRNEGTPLAIIEAMAAGVPVVATAVGGVVDLLGAVEETRGGFEIRERGITAASDDDAGFAAGLRFLLDDATLRARFAGRGRAWVEKTHTKERLLADIIRLYRR